VFKEADFGRTVCYSNPPGPLFSFACSITPLLVKDLRMEESITTSPIQILDDSGYSIDRKGRHHWRFIN
jgi:hypothetical protein